MSRSIVSLSYRAIRADAPDEGSTSSSQSIEMSGRSVRLVTAELRARIIDRLARRLNCSPSDIAVDDGAFLLDDEPTGHDYWNFAGDPDFADDITGTAQPKDPAAYKIVGHPVPRKDLESKVSGAAFIHDIVRPDMLHARILRQPARGATLASLDEAAIRRAARGDFRVVRTGNFVAFVGEDETVVQRAAVAAPAHAKWDECPAIDAGAAGGGVVSDATLGRSFHRRSGTGIGSRAKW